MASKKSLQAAAATSGMFTAAEEPKQTKPKKAPLKQEPQQRETATFSVKIDKEVLKRWRYYAEANGYGDKGRLTEAAVVEYMNRHKLSPAQQKKVDLLCQVD